MEKVIEMKGRLDDYADEIAAHLCIAEARLESMLERYTKPVRDAGTHEEAEKLIADFRARLLAAMRKHEGEDMASRIVPLVINDKIRSLRHIRNSLDTLPF